MFPIIKRWQLYSPWNNTAIASCFSSMEAVFALEGEIISRSPQSEIFCQHIAGKRYFVKRYFTTKGLASYLGWSRLRIEAKNQQWFAAMSLPAAPVVAYGEHRVLLKTLTGVLITEGVENARELLDIAKNDHALFTNKVWLQAVITQLASIVASLHAVRFCHNDFHWRNILVQQASASKQPKVVLIDCPAGKKWLWPLLHYRKMKDLASLDKLAPQYLTRSQRLRFFMAYRQITTLSQQDKFIIGEVIKHKQNRIKRKTVGVNKDSRQCS